MKQSGDKSKRNKRAAPQTAARGENLGWLAQGAGGGSKKQKNITGVSVTSLLGFKAQLYQTQEDARQRKLAGADAPGPKARRRAGIDVSKFERENRGVKERAERDRQHIKTKDDRLEESRRALEQKAALYERLASGKDEFTQQDEERYNVDFLMQERDSRQRACSPHRARSPSPPPRDEPDYSALGRERPGEASTSGAAAGGGSFSAAAAPLRYQGGSYLEAEAPAYYSSRADGPIDSAAAAAAAAERMRTEDAEREARRRQWEEEVEENRRQEEEQERRRKTLHTNISEIAAATARGREAARSGKNAASAATMSKRERLKAEFLRKQREKLAKKVAGE